MKFLKKLNFNKILYLIMTIIMFGFILFFYKSNILPIKYFVLIVVVMLLWDITLFFLLFKKGKKRKIAGYIISIFLLALMSLIYYYLNSTMNFFGNFNETDYKEENYLILVLNDSEYEKLEDLEFHNIGYVPSELTNIDEALAKLNDDILIDNLKYEHYNLLFSDLNESVVESVLVEESNFELLNEDNDYDNFRILYTINIKTEIDISKEINVVKDTFTIYISGIDSYGAISKVSRSDVNMLVTVNPVTKQILLTSVPRDYYVQLRGTTGYKDKLTHAGIYGVETSIGTLEDLLDTDINYYFRVNFSSVEKIVDALGGIDVYSKYTFTSFATNGISYKYTEGYNHLNGEQALVFCRERKNLPSIAGGDRGRGENQQAVIDGLIRKATSSAIITKYTKLLDSLQNTFQTNMTDEDIQKLIKMQLNDMASWNITSYSLDGSDGSGYTYTHPHEELYVMIPDEQTVSTAQNLIDKVYNDEMLDATYDDTASNIKNPIEVEKPIEIKKPTISLVGEREITIYLNEKYIEQGVIISVDATDLTTNLDSVVRSGEVDNMTSGSYVVTYSITDIYGETASVTRTVIVKDPAETILPKPIEPEGSEELEDEISNDDVDDSINLEEEVEPIIPTD